jgi:hypothetical protein
LVPPDTDPDAPFPFHVPENPDTYQLEPNADPDDDWVRSALRDKPTFLRCVKTLATGKAPGPDTLLNETLRYLPDAVLDLVHDMVVKLADGHQIPAALSTSNTVLLYKKGDPTNVNNYRPIGLANSLMKLWTKLLAWVTTEYSEERSILNPGQAGFRPGYYTHIQTQLLAGALEDAKEHRKDIYMLQIDFTNAFNRVNHSKLLRIMQQLGYPPYLVRLIQTVYANNFTSICTPHGPTDTLQVSRGTIQGESLSPVLFAIYIEPLLRWLQYGDRGYNRHTSDVAGIRVDGLTYADDLGIIAGSLTAIRCQARKVTLYSEWVDLAPNLSKSFVTAIFHHTQRQHGATSKNGMRFTSSRLTRHVPLYGRHARYQPPTEPFEYLGVFFTMNLDWTHQKQTMIKYCKQQCDNLARSAYQPHSKLLTLDRLIKRKIAYSFPVVPYTDAELTQIDRECNKVVRSAYGLHKGMPTALMQSSQQQFGLARPSIKSLYAQENVKHLVWSLNHPGRIGYITVNTLRHQLSLLQAYSCPTHSDLQNLSRARHAHMLREASLELTRDLLPFPVDPAPGELTFDTIVQECARSGDHIPPSFLARIRPLWELMGDPTALFVDGHLVNERDLRKHYPHTITDAHIRCHRLVAQALCQSGTTTLRPVVARVMRDHVAPALNHSTKIPVPWPATPPRAAATLTPHTDHRPPPPPRLPPHIAQTAPDTPVNDIRAILRQAQPTDRYHAYHALVQHRPVRTPPNEWSLAILDFMYGWQDQIVRVSDKSDTKVGKKRVRHYRTHWSDSIIDEWALPLFMDHGYHAASTEPDDGSALRGRCTFCGTAAQHGCPHGCPPPAQRRMPARTCADRTRLLRVVWDPKFEPESNLIAEGWQHVIDRYENADTAAREQRLGIPPSPTPPLAQPLPSMDPHSGQNPRWRQALSHTAFLPEPHRPDTDICNTTGTEAVTHQDVPVTTRPQHSPPCTTMRRLYVVHHADGRTVATLTHATIHKLWAAYHTSAAQGADSFAGAVSRLMKGLRNTAAAQLPCIPPPQMLHALMRFFHIQQEGPTTPLHHFPAIPKYWTTSREDSTFGAEYLDLRGTGRGSWFCHLPADHARAYDIARWALRSGHQHDDPFLALLIVPEDPDTGLTRLLRSHPQRCVSALRFPPGSLAFLARTAMEGGDTWAPPTDAPHTMFIIANPHGWNTYGPGEPLTAVVAAVRQSLPGDPEARSAPRIDCSPDWMPGNPTDAYVLLTPLTPDSATQPTPGPTTPVQSPRHAPPLPTLNTFDLKFRPQDVAYTDGSAPSTQRMGMTPGISNVVVWWELPTKFGGI